MRETIHQRGGQRKAVLVSLTLCAFVGLALVAYFRAGSKLATYRQSRILLDTVIDVLVVSSDQQKVQDAMTAAYDEISRLEDALSKYRQESVIHQMNVAAGKAFVPVNEEIRGIVARSLDYSADTQGLFDVTIGPLVDLWGINTDHQRVPGGEEIQLVLPLIDANAVQVDAEQGILLEHPGMAVDLGGIAKGYAIDRATEILRHAGIAHSLINAGGDIRCIGSRPDGAPWRIGVKHPRQEGILGVVELQDSAIATSGDYERYFMEDNVRYHHLLDPRNGFPARDCQSVTIMAPTAEEADVLATAVFIMGPEDGLRFIEARADIEGMIIRADGELVVSSGFSIQLQ